MTGPFSNITPAPRLSADRAPGQHYMPRHSDANGLGRDCAYRGGRTYAETAPGFNLRRLMPISTPVTRIAAAIRAFGELDPSAR